jgi:Leucine-rich repeat (LRR) protein
VACLWSLPTLKTLVIEFSNLMLAPGIPTAFPLASLRLRGYMQDLPDDIGNLQQLTELSLDDFANDTFPDSISGLSRLEQLALIGCPHLVELPEAWLAGLTRLRTFKLRGADMLQSVPDTIGALQRLTLLSISDTPITCLPPSIGQLSSLHILQLHNALVTSLPDTISSLHRLQSMEIVGTPLEELPAGIGGLSSLRTLVLSAAEQGISIPMDFGRLRALERLVFLGPFAHPLPESLADLPRLTSLSFKGCNDVNHIPGTLGRITSLRELRFKDCNMGTLPDAIGDLARLTHLAIHNNFGPDWMPLGNIQVLPAAMWRAVSLRKLHFQNDSVALPTEMTRLTALTELSLVAGELTGDFPPLRCFPRYICTGDALRCRIAPQHLIPIRKVHCWC